MGILMLPAGRAFVPEGAIGSGASTFAVGVVIGWLGMLLRWRGGLMMANWVSMARADGVVLTASLYRIRVEERVLTAALGDRYRNCADGRSRLTPHVW